MEVEVDRVRTVQDKKGTCLKGLPNPILIRNGAAVSLNRHCTTADVLISSAL